MKKFLTILSIIFIITACDGKYVHMKQMLYMSVDNVVQTSDYGVYKEITFSEDMAKQLKLHNYNLNWDKSFYEVFSADVNDETIPETYRKESAEKAEFYKEEIQKEIDIINNLENIINENPDIYNDVVYTTYKMTYMYIKPNGDKDIDICFGRFNKQNKMILFKPSAQAKWTILEKPVYDID